MKKIIFALLALVLASPAYAVDWSKYDSKFSSLYVTGYGGQPGYVAFTNTSGSTIGYLWAHDDGNLYWQPTSGSSFTTAGANTVNLGTTKLNSHGGGIKVNNQ